MGAEDLVGGADESRVEGADPEDGAGLGLAAGAGLGLGLVAAGGVVELDVNGKVTVDEGLAGDGECGLEEARALEGVAGLGLPEGLDGGLVEACGVGRAGLGAGPLALPVVLGRRGDAVAVVAAPDLVASDQLVEGLLDLWEDTVGVDLRVERGGDVLDRPVDGLDVGEESDGLGDVLGERVLDGVGDGVDLAADLGRDVAGDEVVDEVERGEAADRLRGETGVGPDEELLGELDDGRVGPADVFGRAALGAEARDNADDEVDVVREERVELDEPLGGELGEPDVGRELGVLGEPAVVVGVEGAEGGLGVGVLGEDPLGRDLGNVGGLEVDLRGEPVHEPGELDAGAVEAADDLGELLLGGHGEPEPSAPDAAEGLDKGLDVEHLLDVAGDELADFVDHEKQGCDRAAGGRRGAGPARRGGPV